MDALAGETVKRYWRHTLPLEEDAAAVERRARSGIRRGAKKARKAGLTFERRTDAGALDAFYKLHLQTRKHQGVPTQAKRFIDGFGRLFEQGHGFVALVSDEGGPVAAAVFLRWREHLIYKYGASDRSALSKRPNNLLFSEVIRWGCEAGCRELDFGRTDLDHEGLREFKLGWGTDEAPLHHTYAGMAVPGRRRVGRAAAAGTRDSPLAGERQSTNWCGALPPLRLVVGTCTSFARMRALRSTWGTATGSIRRTTSGSATRHRGSRASRVPTTW